VNAAGENHDTIVDSDALLEFVVWSLSALGMEITPDANGRFVLRVPPEHQDSLGSADQIVFSGGPSASPADSPASDEAAQPVERLTTESRLFKWLLHQLAGRAPLHAAPREQPAGIRELTPRLFDPYQVDGGRVHLGGCQFDEVPIFRLTFLSEAGEDDSPRLTDVFVREDGQVVDDTLRATLGLDDLQPLRRPAQRISESRLQAQLAGAKRGAAAVASGAQGDLVAAVVVWCKSARVKLSFVVGDETAYLEYSGWARMIADGSLPLPPYTCPETDVRSYHLAADDNGRITAAEAISTCEESGRRIISSDLTTCAATGRRVLASLTRQCPVSGDRVTSSAVTQCNMCRQEVSPTVVRGGKCLACRSLKSVAKADPRMARVLDERPGLDRWNRWKIAETETVYLLVASAIFRRLLVVIDKESLEPFRVATGSRLGSGWSDVPPVEREELLG
jgi:hypothetical protein